MRDLLFDPDLPRLQCRQMASIESAGTSPSRRRHNRLECSIPVLLREQRNVSRLYTQNVSRSGAFVVTDGAKAERQLLNLSFELPDGAVDVLGVVAWRTGVAEPQVGRMPGMGINFFALAKGDRDRWDHFVLSLQGTRTQEHAAVNALRPELPATPVRRRHPRHTSRFVVRLGDKQTMRDFFTRDVSAGGMFLRVDSLEQVGQRVRTVLVHPETEGEFPIPGHVVRVVDGTSTRDAGVAVQFDELPAEREAALLAFIETGAEFLNTDEEQAARLALLRKAVALEQESPLPLVALGQALLEDLQIESAIEALNGALARDPDCLSAHRALFKAFNILQLPERAKRHLVAIRRLERHSA